MRPAARSAPRRPALPAWAPDWLHAVQGQLLRADGTAVRLLGLRLDASATDAVLAQAADLLAAVPPGARCIGLQLSRAGQVAPAALPRLDGQIARWAAAGAYTMLRLDARLWQRGDHLRLARRYADQPAVQYALAGRPPLAERLWQAVLALRAVHPRALVWLPLESAQAALRGHADAGLGLLWDATSPRAPGLAGALRQPLLLDGWDADAPNPLAHERLMALCRQGQLGWLARSEAGWFSLRLGQLLPCRACHALQRSILSS